MTEVAFSGNRGKMPMSALGFPLSSNCKEELKPAQTTTSPGSSIFYVINSAAFVIQALSCLLTSVNAQYTDIVDLGKWSK